MKKSIVWAVFLCLCFLSAPVWSQPLVKSAVKPGYTFPQDPIETGVDFTYRLTYSCSNTSGPCLNAVVRDLLPPEVVYLGTVPSAPTGDVAAITVTPNQGPGNNQTLVEFTLVSPLTAGNSGDLLINVQFPNGTTPDGTVASNSAEAINLETTPGTFTTPPVDVIAQASPQVNLSKTLASPAYLDRPTAYYLHVDIPNSPGALNVNNLVITDTLPIGDLNANPPIFNGSAPPADCEPACVGTAVGSLSWSGLSSSLGSNLLIQVNVTYPSTDFSDGYNAHNEFTADGEPLGLPSQNFGVGAVDHTVDQFVAIGTPGFGKNAGGPVPPTFGQEFYYYLTPENTTSNVPMDNMVVVDTLPVQIDLTPTGVTTGAYSNLDNYSAGEGVRVEYEHSGAPGTWLLWGSSPDTLTNTALAYPPAGLPAGQHITRIRWLFGQAQVGMAPVSFAEHPRIYAQVINPDHNGNPVSIGDTVQNCGSLDATFQDENNNTQNVNRNACMDFLVNRDFVQLQPIKNVLNPQASYNAGDTVNWRIIARSHSYSSTTIDAQFITVSDLLPIDLVYVPGSQNYNANGTAIAAPVFTQIDNYNNTGRTLLQWTWPAGSGTFNPNESVILTYDTTVREGAQFGLLGNSAYMQHNDPTRDQRCFSSQPDSFDFDQDGDTTENTCQDTENITIAPIAQLEASKLVKGVCDADYVSGIGETLPGGTIDYQLTIKNRGTLAMQNFVIVDILPFVGDTGVKDLNPRGSQWEPVLSSPIAAPPGVTIYYSTSGNPCRDEIGTTVPGCEAPNWTTAPPSPITSVKSFKAEFNANVIAAYDDLVFHFRMMAPGDAPAAGEIAYNSFGYLGEREDGFGNLSAEPQKVGIRIGSCSGASLGNYVWIDEDQDGTQNETGTGLNNVQVDLTSAGPDGVIGSLDDVVLATAFTSNDGAGNPGWYEFPGLAAGSYQVCFTPPPPYQPTQADQGGNDSLDSDADPVSFCAPPVTLAANENNPDIDLGLLPLAKAALGNYVWYDLNNDGVQNEPVFNGVNGVTVLLFADDGDGVAEPGGDDVQVAATVTGNDSFNQPGYYLFDQLTPGVQYFVQCLKPDPAVAFTAADSGGDDSQDSDANTGNGVTPLVNLAPGEFNATIDCGLIFPAGNLSLGNQVWFETDNDDLFEPQNGEAGINGVRLNLYRDSNGDGLPTLDEYISATVTGTENGFVGRYAFDDLAAGDYIVVVDPSNFSGSGPLAGLRSCFANDPAPDPDNDINGDDNGGNIGALIGSFAITLNLGGEPITDGDASPNSNLSLDFCFTDAFPPLGETHYDYGDAPDVTPGSATADYQTTQLDGGAVHALPTVPGTPFLGTCVDGDNGLNQDALALADDNDNLIPVGGCATPGDDENGVTFSSTTLSPGDALSITVTGGGVVGVSSCLVNGWIDWNGNGIFEAAEQVSTDTNVNAGNSFVINTSVPAGTMPGPVYARFRCASTAGLGPVGPAADGEVEDYRIDITGQDWGDAPDSYATAAASNGPVHQVNPADALFLGSCVDLENDGQAATAGNDANGDDTTAGSLTIGPCFDDEDGITFLNGNELAACQINDITVISNKDAFVDAWIDFNGNGVFDPATEQVLSAMPVLAGSNTVGINVPCNANTGLTYARFRISSGGGLPFDGPAADGEVEDYRVQINGVDFGDAPASYATTQSGNGALHGVSTSNPLYLGSCVDTEADGQPDALALLDDNTPGTGTVGTCTGNDDEDGVVFDTPLIACANSQITVTANTAGVLEGWIDFDGNGVFDPAEKIIPAQTINSGANTLSFPVPCTANIADTYARFRLSSAGVFGPVGAAPDGEVEDYRVSVFAGDFGDLPDSYSTTLASNGPVHAINSTASLYLGSCVDGESDGVPGINANGDDQATGSPVAGTCTNGDDEDGVIFTNGLTVCEVSNISVTASAAGLLDAWVDFNANGSFEPAEQVFSSQAVTAGNNALSFTVPCSAVPGAMYSRFRLSSAGGLSPDGMAADGEVEDYVETKAGSADLSITKTDNVDPVAAGDNITYTVTVSNAGPNEAAFVRVNDTLPAGVTLVSTSGCLEDPAAIPQCTLGDIAAGASASYTVTVTVAADTAAGTVLTNAATAITSTNELDPSNNSTTEDTLVQAISDLAVSKVDNIDPVTAGQALSYTITVVNNGPSDAQNVQVSETLPANVSLVSTSGCAEDPSAVPQCSLGSLAAGASSSYVVNVMVDPSATGVLSNTVTVGSDSTDPDNSNDSDTETTALGTMADLSVMKVDDIDPAPPGTTVTYTITVSNTGPSTAVNVVATDTLPAGVTLVSTNGCAEDPTGIPSCSLGNILPGNSAQYTVSVTIDNGTAGTITNTVSVSSDTSDPNPGNNTASEDTVAEAADLSVSKVDNVDPVRAGENVTYTITVNNAGPSPAQNVVVTDTLPAGVSLVATSGCAEDPSAVPTCSLGTIAVNGSAQYTVTVAVDAALPAGTIHNAVSVTADTFDPNTGNNDNGEDTQVITEADLAVNKIAHPSGWIPLGGTVSYEIIVTNNGPSDAVNVSSTEALPAGLTFSDTSGCLEDPNGVPTCSLGTLNPGQSVTYWVNTTVNEIANGTFSNTVTVGSDTTDPNPDNNESTNDAAALLRDIPGPGRLALMLLMLALAALGWQQRRQKGGVKRSAKRS
jgi:uncharacterized repeat protein (TIGR01451 family)